jgi:hypothetical protein
MGVLEAIVQQSEVGDAHAPALVQHLLPALAGTLGSKRETGDVRFWALKVLWEVTARLLSPLLASPNSSSESAPVAKCKGELDTSSFFRGPKRDISDDFASWSPATETARNYL